MSIVQPLEPCAPRRTDHRWLNTLVDINPEPLTLTLNGEPVSTTFVGAESLAQLLRVRLALTGTKIACGLGECGACTVLVDGIPVNSCIYPAAKVHGRSVETIEGLGSPKQLGAMQRSFIEVGGFQCGFCTPGQVVRATALIREIEAGRLPAEAAAVRLAMSGNICRCTGYDKIVESVLAVAETKAAE